MKATLVTVKFDPKWILENQSSGTARVIDEVLKVIKNYCGRDGGIFVIDREFHRCSLIVAGENDLIGSEISRRIREEICIIAEDTAFEVDLEQENEAELKAKLIQSGYKPSEEERAFLRENFHFETENENRDAACGASEKSIDTDKLIGLDAFKQWINEVGSVAEKYRDIAAEAEIFKNMLLLLSVNRGNGLTTMLKITAKTLKDTNFVEFVGKKDVIEWYLSYSDSPDEFPALEGLLRQLHMCEEQGAPFKGIVAVNIEEWIDHLTDKRFALFLDFVWNNRAGIFFVFVVPYAEEDVLAEVRARLNDVMNVRTLKVIPPSDKEYFKYFAGLFAKFDIAVEEDVFGAFVLKITGEKNDGRFYGFNTVKKIADEVLYRLIADAATKGGDIPKTVTAEIFSKCCLLEEMPAASGLEQLNDMVALDNVKARVKEIISTVKFQKEMYKKGGEEIKPCLHMMFTGNPGTGKTVVARIIGRIFKEEGILPIGNFFEVSRKDFIGKFVGHTAPKTMEICRNAIGSVLFIDEAYTLADNRDGYSSEAIGTLIAEMENNRDKMVVIFAGYENELERLFDMNPGLKDRIPYKIDFPNYTREELEQIFFKNIDKKMKSDDKFRRRADEFFGTFPDEIMQMRDFSNGRFVRNLSERVISKAALRFEMSEKDISEFELTDSDFDVAVADNDFKKLFSKPARANTIGFKYETK